MSFTSRDFRRTMGCFATGITVVSTVDAEGRPVGVTINSFSSVSLDPPLVSFCLVHSARSLPAFREAGKFAVNVLAEDQQALSEGFAVSPSLPWNETTWHAGPATGCPLLAGCLATMECELDHEAEGGDHTVLLGRVVKLEHTETGRPLLYFRGRYGFVRPDEN